jgi:hypothetical protein
MCAAEPGRECNVLGNTESLDERQTVKVWPEKSVCPEAAHCRELGRRIVEKSIMCLAETQRRTVLEKRIF